MHRSIVVSELSRPRARRQKDEPAREDDSSISFILPGRYAPDRGQSDWRAFWVSTGALFWVHRLGWWEDQSGRETYHGEIRGYLLPTRESLVRYVTGLVLGQEVPECGRLYAWLERELDHYQEEVESWIGAVGRVGTFAVRARILSGRSFPWPDRSLRVTLPQVVVEERFGGLEALAGAFRLHQALGWLTWASAETSALYYALVSRGPCTIEAAVQIAELLAAFRDRSGRGSVWPPAIFWTVFERELDVGLEYIAGLAQLLDEDFQCRRTPWVLPAPELTHFYEQVGVYPSDRRLRTYPPLLEGTGRRRYWADYEAPGQLD